MIKRFRGGDRERGEREWRALKVLATYAPGLAPEPWESDLAAPEPWVMMSRLDGTALRGSVLRDEHIKALAEAVREVHSAVPPDVLDGVPPRSGRQGDLVAQVHSWFPRARGHVTGRVGEAMDAGPAWLAGAGLQLAGRPGRPGVPWVFGPGDGNLANYLWSGSKVQVVDFEESGRSDRAFELAEITEHVSSWVEHPLDVSAFLGHFDLTAAESTRLRGCRRLLALVWLFLLAFDDKDSPRNPPGTAGRQADRLLALLA